MVIIIGAGMAGLTCAHYLQQRGTPFVILEASDGVGGRLRTDRVDGFLLDRGFQVFQTGYPEAKPVLRYAELGLQPLPSGARIRTGKTFFNMPNPLRNWAGAPEALMAPVGGFSDKLRVLKLQGSTRNAPAPSADDANAGLETTGDYLRRYGFSEKMIARFFKPFFRGVFLERALDTDAALFRFLFHQFATADVALPENGIGAIAEQLAAGLTPEQLQLRTPVQKIEGKRVFLADGTVLEGTTIVIATEASTAAGLLGKTPNARFNHTDCLYFYSEQPLPKSGAPYLIINSNNNEIIDHIMPLSDAVPSYAPAGKTLISVSLVGKGHIPDAELTEKVQAELVEWFGQQTTWHHLKTYRIKEALPAYLTGKTNVAPQKINDYTFCCGDYTAYPSLNGAMESGRKVAEMCSANV